MNRRIFQSLIIIIILALSQNTVFTKCLLHNKYCIIFSGAGYEEGDEGKIFGLYELTSTAFDDQQIIGSHELKDEYHRKTLSSNEIENKIFLTGDEIYFFIRTDEDKCKKYSFEEQGYTPIAYNSIPIFSAPIIAATIHTTGRGPASQKIFPEPVCYLDHKILKKSGSLYTYKLYKQTDSKKSDIISGKIIITTKKDDKDQATKTGKEKTEVTDKTINLIIGKESDKDTIKDYKMATYMRYYLGLHVGTFLPVYDSISKKPYNETSFFTYPSFYKPSVFFMAKQNYRWGPKAIILGSIYPFGFEPERWNSDELAKIDEAKDWGFRPIQVVIGTELSDKIFKTLYLGLGYCFSYISVNLMVELTRDETLKLSSRDMAILPLGFASDYKVTKNRCTLGFAITIPADFWIGKLISSKL